MFRLFGRLFGRRQPRYRPYTDASAYLATASLLSWPELTFYRLLATLAQPTETVMVKVRVADLVAIDKRRFPDHTPAEQQHFYRIAPLHVDFVLCERQSLRPLLAIELDGSTHRTNPRQMASDAWKERVLAQVGLPILRVPYRPTYDVRELHLAIRARVGSPSPIAATASSARA